MQFFTTLGGGCFSILGENMYHKKKKRKQNLHLSAKLEANCMILHTLRKGEATCKWLQLKRELHLLDSLVVECWLWVLEAQSSIPSQGPHHTRRYKNRTSISLASHTYMFMRVEQPDYTWASVWFGWIIEIVKADIYLWFPLNYDTCARLHWYLTWVCVWQDVAITLSLCSAAILWSDR